MDRMTKQRKLIMEALEGTASHPTADEIYDMVRIKMPRISLGTVYRNLDLLSKEGKILKIDTCGCQMRFDSDLGEHAHVRCVRCGKVEDLEAPPGLVRYGEKKLSSAGYSFVASRVEFAGMCPRCRKEEG